MKHSILAAALLTSCGSSDTAYTWGDVADELSTAYCKRFGACIGYTAAEVVACEQHTNFHFCLKGNCSTELPPEAADETAACVEAFEKALSEADCIGLVYYGIIPAECGPILGRNPDHAEEQ